MDSTCLFEFNPDFSYPFRMTLRRLSAVFIILGLFSIPLSWAAPQPQAQAPASAVDAEQKLLAAMHTIASQPLYDYVREMTSEKYGGRSAPTPTGRCRTRRSPAGRRTSELRPNGRPSTGVRSRGAPGPDTATVRRASRATRGEGEARSPHIRHGGRLRRPMRPCR